MKLCGIDVSSHQGNIDWEKVKKSGGVSFAILRCGWGSDLESQDDSKFERNVQECDRLGIPWGAYLYSYAMTEEEAQSEAAHVLRLLKGKKPLYPICFDMEDADGYKAKRGGLSKELATSICMEFLKTLEANEYYAMLYANKDWMMNKLDMNKLKRFDCWLAQWNDEPTYEGQFGIWQYSSDGEVPGISGRVDMNQTTGYRDYPSYMKENGTNNWEIVDEPEVSDSEVNVFYRVKTKEGRWLGEVTNLEDYAGWNESPITDVAIKVDIGNVKYRVHNKNGDWLPYVTDYDINNSSSGYAGNGNEIDAIEVYYYTPSNIRPAKKAKYRIAPVGKSYYSWQFDNEKKDGQDGYAGMFGNSIGRFQIVIE